MPAATFLVCENGDYLLTESGDYLVLSLGLGGLVALSAMVVCDLMVLGSETTQNLEAVTQNRDAYNAIEVGGMNIIQNLVNSKIGVTNALETGGAEIT